jgi:hypothetical protein
MYFEITPASSERATPALIIMDALGSSVYPPSKVPAAIALTCWPISS